jgi:hypothetical protein
LAAGNIFGAQLSIPAGRLPGGVIWTSNQVGVVGGIPNVTTIYTNLYPSNTYADIITAIGNCPSNQVVYLNAGTYIINNVINWGYAPAYRNGAVLRGAGMGKTILLLTNGAVSISGGISMMGFGYMSGSFTGNAMNWTGGYAQGTTNITIGSATNYWSFGTPIKVGDMLWLTQEEDTNVVNLIGEEGARYVFLDARTNGCAQGNWVTITGIANGTNLTIWPGVQMTNIQSSLQPQVLWPNTYDYGSGILHGVKMNGIEDMTVVGSGNNADAINIVLNNTYNCWVKNVETTNSWYAGIQIWGSAHDTVQECYIHNVASGGASKSYGVNPATSSDCLIQNNIFDRVTAPILIDNGASGNVFAYNFATNMIYISSPGYMMASYQTHGAHTAMNLFEGNVGTAISLDFIHGSGSHETMYRNCLWGVENDINLYPGAQNYNVNGTHAMEIMTTNRVCSSIGNVLGTDGYSTIYLSIPTNPAGQGTHIVYQIGFGGTVGDDIQTLTSLWRNGDYDYATHSTVWDGNGAVTLPNSLYLAGKPSWWSNSVPWPPIGSDLTPMVSAIPAQLRFAMLMGTLTKDSPVPAPPSGLNATGAAQ